MQNVISAEQAKKITRGRTPLVPLEYEEACKALAACRTLDEAKYWDNKADALAAWAKIYHDNKAGRQARALKLWAYRRMGELAQELRPRARQAPRKESGAHGGTLKGPFSLLMENGLTDREARAARRLARATSRQMEAIVSLPRPPSPGYASEKIFSGPAISQIGGSKAFSSIYGWTDLWGSVTTLHLKCSNISASELGRSIRTDRVSFVRPRITELLEWLDEFERHLPSGKK